MLPSLLLQLLCFSTLATAGEKKEVKIHKTPVNDITNLFYFEDSNVILIHDRAAGEVRRSDDAGNSWSPVEGVEKGAAVGLVAHPYDSNVAYIMGGRSTHWTTQDKGEKWRAFKTDAPPSLFREPFTFHAGNSDKVLFHGQKCESILQCEEITYYTKDAFQTLEKMRSDTRGCTFAKATPLFETKNDDTVICVVKGRYSGWKTENRIMVSDNYFKEEHEPHLEGDRTVQGIINIAPVKGFIVAAAKAEGTDELALYVTKDAESWHRAVFPSDHRLEEDAYTILESTNYSIQVDVMTTPVRGRNPMGVLFSSNSNGTYFTRNIEHTNRNINGIVDFEKVQGIQGIILANVVDNWEDVENFGKEKKLMSRISFDDGRTFQPLSAHGKDQDLHLHSVTDMSNIGRVFSSPAPGIVMGVGNIGKHLKKYDECDTWVSDDAGVTWKEALKEAHKYEFGDQGAILVAIYDEGPTDKIKYSINHGQDWETKDLGEEVKARFLSTTPDSTSLKFVLLASQGGGAELKYVLYFIDFEDVLDKTCKKSDFEKWYARLDEKGKPDCLMGHKQYYMRRKADANCFVDEEFKEAEPQYEDCECTEEDYECDYNFVRSEDKKSCEQAGKIEIPQGECKNSQDTYKGSSGFRLIPGNTCKDGKRLDEDKERSCNESTNAPANGTVSHTINSFKANSFREYYYLEKTESSHGNDETVIMRTDEQKIYLSKNHGKTWEQILKDEEIRSIYPHQYINDNVYFLTSGKKVFYSTNRGDNIRHFKTKAEPTHDRLQTIGFHPKNKDWLIWTGAVDCGSSEGNCRSVAYITKNRGGEWGTLLEYVRKCEFIKQGGRGTDEKLVYCEQYEDENPDGRLQLRSSDSWFDKSELQFRNVVDFATMAEFIIVAAKDQDEKSLKVDASVDGRTFAAAEFPSNFDVPVQRAYTVLDSSTHAVFLHVTVGSREDFEYGSIIKSNSNGTSYVLSLNGVNRNTQGYVDFEKMLGIEGVAIVNVVDNVEEAERGIAKKLRTMITHNDAAEWAPIPAPQKDAEDQDYKCDVKDSKKCSLHLHGYTERRDPRNTFSSPSAVGLMMGVGNVGEFLTRKAEADTFITRDGGLEWHSVKKGNYMWEYGDQGAIIVIVEENVATDVIFYSLDEGANWTAYKFTDSKMKISEISTVPSDSSQNFLLWGQDVSSGKEIATVNLDFTGLRPRQCVLNETNPEDEGSDYRLWKPKHPLSDDDCLFGHVAQFYRKKVDADCYNGRRYRQLHNYAKNCTCTRQDFEW